ncbi:uncharacterized protein A1O9_03892 [Exophiala aquamarina CBS 119918]|uniref:Aminotransferase class I/classII large domain-containing protein n=1 Tax=Exophiala aquamarina CBS 119918 TaxID=1182545 RepID=A0A072PFY7_9EURO|nr:uncharacterized protein A1O9_03892 [Exophiala aquamarina CBS 119918]KEF59049.1 hypothetical protein A1O9_03892 [Exophiala aquamarina CBS 119918]
MKYVRMATEIELPEEYGYDKIKNNLSESSVTGQTLQSLGLTIPTDLILVYNEHRGGGRLRELIVAGSGLSKDDVLITLGVAGALFIISTSQLTKKDHLVVVRPNYATNIETPKAIGCNDTYVDLSFELGFAIDLSSIASAIKPSTRIVSVTCPHNPTGVVIPRETLNSLDELTKAKGCLLLVDETYRDIQCGEKLPLAASLGDHIISVSSLSKSYGIPGIRCGWLITQNEALQEEFLAAKEQINISGSVIDEWIAEQVLERHESILFQTTQQMETRLDLVEAWIEKEDLLEWVRPSGGVVCFPRMKVEPPGGTTQFYERLLLKHATYVGPGHWFEMPDTFFRLGLPTLDQLQAGMDAISQALRT